jgi:predicted aspartyl protease
MGHHLELVAEPKAEVMSNIFVDQTTGELRGQKPAKFSHTTLAVLGAAAFVGFLLTVAAVSPPSPSGSAEARSGSSIPFRSINGGMFIYANLGGVPHNMQLDTGASSSTVTLPIAQALVARGRATVVPGWFGAQMADGRVVAHQNIIVHRVSIGGYVLHNVEMGVTPDGANLLFGLSELNAIGSFTIDQSRHQIRFN